jgi:hypothetical protein
MKPFYFSLAAFGTMSIPDAVHCAQSIEMDILGNPISANKLQLCPQNRRGVNRELCDILLERYPDTEFRLHANVNITGRPFIVDASNWGDYTLDWFTTLREYVQLLKTPLYTLHAGRRDNCTLPELFDKVREIEDFLQISVGVEGLYPEREGKWLINSWQEYEAMLNSGVNYALDLSHLNIVAYYEQSKPLDLLKALLESKQCIEVHISDNEGYRDSHFHIVKEPWWWDSLQFTNPSVDIFTEGVISTQTFIN